MKFKVGDIIAWEDHTKITAEITGISDVLYFYTFLTHIDGSHINTKWGSDIFTLEQVTYVLRKKLYTINPNFKEYTKKELEICVKY